MNKKKRFKNSLAVRLQIAKDKEKATRDIRQAESLEASIGELIQQQQESYSEGVAIEIDIQRKQATKLRKHHSYLIDRKIPMLVRVMSKLNTGSLPGFKVDSELEEAVK